MKLTLIDPYAVARPIANFKLEPEAQCFFSIYAEAQEVLASKPRKKKAYKASRQKTIAPDSVEAVRMWQASHGHGTHYPKTLSEIPSLYGKCPPEVQRVPHEGTVLPRGATNPLTE